ncbi:MAG TPA: DNA alkylation repair protein [Planctomycetota bacterium]|nr:DNA alkylation repair protein [Planctomycetota bacterium]
MPATKKKNSKSTTTKNTNGTKRPPVARKPPPERFSLAGVMSELEHAGSEQTRKTYARHGAVGPMFGVSFATLKALRKRIGVDHELALALWNTGNFDARNLAVKILDPARMKSGDLDRWISEAPAARMCGGYVAMVAAEGPHAATRAAEWLRAKDERTRVAGWTLLAQLAQRDEAMADDVFAKRLEEIAATIHTSSNAERECMNGAVIGIGGRSAGLRKLALAAARRIGKVEIDYGDTACKTPDAAEYIEKAWAHAKAKGFATPAAQEREREVPRLRC